MTRKRRILSGMRPTGRLHIGHYFGTLANWARLQGEYDTFYFVADWHVLTDHQEGLEGVAAHTREMVADWMACGLDPNRSTFFVQSAIPEHLELAWILGALTPVGDLERCPTYKEVAANPKKSPNYAILGYPVLQCADIALYKGEFVPVGEDQVAHLEICREIVRRFNKAYREVFPEPQPKLSEVPRLAGLDGQSKMSKSLGNTLDLAEEPETIRKRVATMFTDPARVKRTDPGHPDICNVYTWHGLFGAGDDLPRIHRDCTTAAIGCTDCKREMAERVVKFLAPIREKRAELLGRAGELDEIIAAGNERARKVARATMAEVRDAMGLSR